MLNNPIFIDWFGNGVSILAIILASIFGFRQLKISKKQNNIADKQLKLGFIQNEINVLSFEISRKESQRTNAHAAFLVLTVDEDPITRPKSYSDKLKSIKHFQDESDELVAELNKQLKKYEDEAKRSVD